MRRKRRPGSSTTGPGPASKTTRKHSARQGERPPASARSGLVVARSGAVLLLTDEPRAARYLAHLLTRKCLLRKGANNG